MCFLLYIAADSSIEDIPFNTESPGLSITSLSDFELPLRNVFEKSHMKCIGSSHGCGCGYRHLSYQNGAWPEEYLIGLDPESGAEKQSDHEALYLFVLDQLQRNDSVELYGCWDGDFQEPFACRETISVEELIKNDFFLRERCHYSVTR